MSTALDDIQTAVYNTLTGDATLMGLVTGVFDAVPQGQAYPYIAVGEATEVRFNTFGRDGKDDVLTLHVWSDYHGFAECYDILAEMNRLLDYQSIAVGGHDLVYLRAETANAFVDESEGTNETVLRHLVAPYRAVVQEV